MGRRDAGPVLEPPGVFTLVEPVTHEAARVKAWPGRSGWRRVAARRRTFVATGAKTVADIETMLSLLEEFSVIDCSANQRTARSLATVLFTDIVDSTTHAVVLGDRAWKRVLDHHDEIAQSAVSGCGGHLVKWTGDGILATFDAPARAIECAKAMRSALAHGGIAIRAGMHTGEVELRHGDIAGLGVNIAARVAGTAHAGELLVSRTVGDIVSGAGYTFASRGRHTLKGVPGHWELLAVS